MATASNEEHLVEVRPRRSRRWTAHRAKVTRHSRALGDLEVAGHDGTAGRLEFVTSGDGPDALAFYLWPPRWVDSAPETESEDRQLADVVFESSLPGGLRMKACRDGMVAWDFTAWGGNPSLRPLIGEGGKIDPEPVINTQVRCLRLMNAHLACLHRSVPNSLESPQALSPNHFLKIRFSDCDWLVGNVDDPGGYLLALTRKRPDVIGVKLREHRPVLSTESLEAADSLLRQLLRLESSEMALLRVESIYRSVVAYCSFDHAAALVNAFVAIEGLLGDLLARHLNEHDQNGAPRVDNERRKYLEGSAVNSRITAEILSLAGVLPQDLYRGIRACAKARNRWMHDAAPDTTGSLDGERAIRVASGMFFLVEGVDIRPPVVRHLMSLG